MQLLFSVGGNEKISIIYRLQIKKKCIQYLSQNLAVHRPSR